MTTGGLRTGQVAAAAGVNRQTLRYYERRGLLAKPERSLGGHRLYPPETVTRLRSIKTAQRLGFSLAEVADLLDSTGHRPGSHTDDVGLRAGAAAKLAEVEARITELTAVAATLRDALSVGCDDLVTCARVPDCPLPFSELADDPAPPGTFRPA